MQFMILSTRFWRSFSLACAVCVRADSWSAFAQVHQFRNYTAADEEWTVRQFCLQYPTGPAGTAVVCHLGRSQPL